MAEETGRRVRLRELREERGWSQQDLADHLIRVAWMRHHKTTGVNADMISKWERGEKRPSPFYRDLLCLLFHTDADYLGIGGRASGAAALPHMSAVDGSLATTLDGAASILDQLGAAGAILQPKMFDVWKDEVMQRRAMLKLMGLTPAAAALSPEQEKQRRTRSGAPTPETMRDLDQLADRYQTLYHSTAPAVLMTPVLAHLDTLGDLSRGPYDFDVTPVTSWSSSNTSSPRSLPRTTPVGPSISSSQARIETPDSAYVRLEATRWSNTSTP